MTTRRIDVRTLLAAAGIALGLALVVYGLSVGLTGRDASNLPDAIEGLSPGDGDRVLRQSQVIVDFVEGFTGELSIDGIVIPTTRIDQIGGSGAQPAPGAQVDLPPTAIFDPGNFVLSFLPQAGAPIEAFGQGEHIGVVRYWRILDGERAARTYTWRFFTD